MAVSRRVAALCGSAGVALFALTGSAFAGDTFGWSASLTGTSDYVFRGVSQTNNDPTIQGSIGATYGLFYAGAWGSGLDWNGPTNASDPKAQVEIDWYAGVKPTWGKANFDFGVIYYTYPGSTKSPQFGDTSILELKAGVSGEILPKLTAGATYYYAVDVNDFKYGVIEGSLAYALPKTWVFDPTVSGVYGFQDAFGPRTTIDYSYWNAGITLAVDKLAFDFRYWDTDLSSKECFENFFGQGTCDSRFVASATISLP